MRRFGSLPAVNIEPCRFIDVFFTSSLLGLLKNQMKLKKSSLNRLLVAICGLNPLLVHSSELNGLALSNTRALPFVGMILSIALLPMLTPVFWHHHFGKVALGWGLAFLLPCITQFGAAQTQVSTNHTLVAEYLPFIILLATLFVVAGGICVQAICTGHPDSIPAYWR
jgi:ABC-type Mn2+/Zn2+ transport system permease subunit